MGEHVVLFEEYASSYPYAEDGRIPAPSGTGLLEPLTTLSFLAAHTTTTRLGTAMVLLPQRNPVYTAKEVSTLDWLSNGRVDLGIGVGWLEEEFDAVNVPWPRRGRRTDEYLEVLRTLWCDETSAHEGEFYSLTPCQMFPSPSSSPTRPSTSAGSPTPPCAGWPGPARDGTPSTGAPISWPSRWPRWTGCWPSTAGPGRTSPSPSVPTSSPSTPTSPGAYAEAGVDAVAALLLPFSEDDVRKALDDLQPVFDRAADVLSGRCRPGPVSPAGTRAVTPCPAGPRWTCRSRRRR